MAKFQKGPPEPNVSGLVHAKNGSDKERFWLNAVQRQRSRPKSLEEQGKGWKVEPTTQTLEEW